MAVVIPNMIGPNNGAGPVGRSLLGARNGLGFAGCRALVLDPSLTNRRLLHDILADLRCAQVVSVSMIDDASRLRAIVRVPRPFVESQDYFGPDRRRHHLEWPGLERRRQAHLADRRAARDPTYAGPERRLEQAAEPPPLPTQGVATMSKSREIHWRA